MLTWDDFNSEEKQKTVSPPVTKHEIKPEVRTNQVEEKNTAPSTNFISDVSQALDNLDIDAGMKLSLIHI